MLESEKFGDDSYQGAFGIFAHDTNIQHLRA
jgi:hypothetical protein